ncbi:MAG TPA: hypothetical protein VLK82_15670 [Candidatus Tectomicrobia bacterium]|nr:hypothetical protein [Candidatus Tectomicrobia bacterium]
MSETTDLNAQIAQRLFGWEYHDGLWAEPSGPGDWCMHVTPPAYSIDPAQAARVWQWIEALSVGVDYLKFDYYPSPPTVRCWIQLYHHEDFLGWQGGGATWQDALCRAALALAAAIGAGEGEA